MRVLALLFVFSLFHIPGISEKSAIQIVQTDPLILQLPEQLNLQFHLYNVDGAAVLHWQENQVGPGIVVPDCSWEAMEEGIYFLKILCPQDSALAKIVIH